MPMIHKSKPYPHNRCGASTSIDDETITFGWGELDGCGFWEHPCVECAEAFKKRNPTYKVWPTRDEEGGWK